MPEPFGPGGATWSASGEIVYSSAGDLRHVSGAGGDCSPLYADTSAVDFRRPTFLPDGNHFLFTRAGQFDSVFQNSVMLGSLDRDTLRIVESVVRDPEFHPPATVFYGLDEKQTTPVNQILVAEMDMQAFTVAAEPDVVGSVILASAGFLSYTVSHNGTFAYLTGHLNPPPLELDRTGQQVADLRDQPQGVWSWNVGTVLSRLFLASEDRGLFLYDWEAGAAPEPLGIQGLFPVAGPGDTLVAFQDYNVGSRGVCSVGVANVNRRRVDTIFSGPPCLYPTDWSPDGDELLLSDQLPWLPVGDQPPAIWTYSLADDSLRPTVRDPRATAYHGTYSPDGQWIAFSSDRTGRCEVYIQRRDGPSGPQPPVSRNGGTWPRWRSDSRQLYFIGPAGQVYGAQIPPRGPTDNPPQRLFSLQHWTGMGYQEIGTLFDVAPDGDRFFVSRRSIDPTYLVVIQNGTN